MESLAICCSLPMGWLLSAVYCVVLVPRIKAFPRARQWVLLGSLAVVSCFAYELALLGQFGVRGAMARMGPWFSVVHPVVLLLTAPALANALLLPRFLERIPGRPLIATLLCGVLSLVLALLLYTVDDYMHGVDGVYPIP